MSVADALDWVADWYLPFLQGKAPAELMQQQVERYLRL
jgi:hypothetical protein